MQLTSLGMFLALSIYVTMSLSSMFFLKEDLRQSSMVWT